MKKILLALFTLSICSCVSKKSTFTALNTGNYDQAINTSLNKLRTNKNKKSRQEYILILEEAFVKASEKDLNSVSFLEKEGNPANLERIYNTYITLKNRQETIRPLLPLYHVEQGRNANFSFDNYDQKILNTKEKLSTYLYNNAKSLLSNAKQKNEYRSVYDDLIYLEKISPNYKNSQELIKEAHYKGTNFVKVTMKNRTEVVIPKRLESDLLNFNTYGLDDLWTVYHGNSQPSVNYDYEMEVALREINISPERIKERELQREKQVKDGWEYLLDENNDYVLDEEGKKIKVDKMITVRCKYYEFTQFKETQVVGNVQYKNLATNQLLDAFPLSSTYVFQHIYANYKGDQRALEDNLVGYLGLKSVPFPTNEQMVYDSGEDLKNRIKNIITQYRF